MHQKQLAVYLCAHIQAKDKCPSAWWGGQNPTARHAQMCIWYLCSLPRYSGSHCRGGHCQHRPGATLSWTQPAPAESNSPSTVELHQPRWWHVAKVKENARQKEGGEKGWEAAEEVPGSEKGKEVLQKPEQVLAACWRDSTQSDSYCSLWWMHNIADGYVLKEMWLMENTQQRTVVLKELYPIWNPWWSRKKACEAKCIWPQPLLGCSWHERSERSEGVGLSLSLGGERGKVLF